MTLDTRARSSAQAIDRSATRLDPVAALDDLLRRRRRQPLRRALAGAALAVLVLAVAIWAGVALRGPTPIEPTLGPVTRFRAGPGPISVAVTPGAAWVLNTGDTTISRIDPGSGRVQASLPLRRQLIFATAAEGRLWVVHVGAPASSDERVDPVEISVIDPSTNRTVSRFGFGTAGWFHSALARSGTWPSDRELSGSPSRGRMRSRGSTPPRARYSTALACRSRPRWPWTARRSGSRPPMGSCTASTSPPAP